MSIFDILWLGLWNKSLATGRIVLSLAWFEMVVATAIVYWSILRADRGN